MSTEKCQICGCVVPFCKHTDGHQNQRVAVMIGADLDQEMAEAAMLMCGIDPAPKLPQRTREKTVYRMVNPEIIPATSLSDIPAHVGKFVACGFILHADGERHEFKTRTSLLVKIDIEEGYIETLNSIYRIV